MSLCLSHPDVDRRPAQEFRARCRKNEFSGPSAGQAHGFVQANLVILPQEYAFDFVLFCLRNPKPCPLLEALDSGSYEPQQLSPGGDLRTDLPKYRVYENGELVNEVTDITSLWRDDFVSFLLGCSFSFEQLLLRQGIPVRHLEEKGPTGAFKNVPMYRTNISCRSTRRFQGPLVVSMRPIPSHLVAQATEITGRFPQLHGGPVHIGDPSAIGIKDINTPDWGEAVTIHAGEVCVFWACGVTPQAVIMESKPSIVITHAPGHMYITDLTEEELLQSDKTTV
eukprot:GILJ01008330.1.p1 GENE.GILJ01008330.1~~GILJ01008330.1.p1  ORF type:complete len:293 (+),score=24.34 GILJ01008330.1:37-879(+)